MIENIEAEQAVLGSILLEPSVMDECILQPKHMADGVHAAILNAMRKAHEKGETTDLVVVYSYLQDSDIGGISYLTDLADSVASVHAFQHYQRLVLEAYKLREARIQAMKFSEEPSEESLTKMIEKLSNLDEIGRVNEEKNVQDWLNEIAHDMTFMPEETQGGCETGMIEFDEMTGGLQPEDLIIVAARPSMGKTAFALNIVAGHCKNGGYSHIFSLEMSAKSLLHRMLSAEGNVDMSKWKDPHLLFEEDDYTRATTAIGTMSDWKLGIYENAQMVSDIRATVKQAIEKNPDEKHLVVIDYLQLMRASRRYDNRVLEIGDITRDLKMLARELKVPVVLLSQLSRAVEQRQDKRPIMSDLRESGNIEQDADLVAFLYRDDYYDENSESQNITEIIVRKHRNGPTGTVEMLFIKEHQSFLNLDYSREEAFA